MERVTKKNINTVKYWNGFATDGYSESDRRRGGNICKFSHVLEYIKPNLDVLDIGCLNGNFYNFIQEKGFNIRSFTGIDHSPDLIALAKKRFPRHNWQISDCYSLPFKNETFDVVTAMEILEHLDEPERLLQEMKRVTKTNGSIIITVPNCNIIKDAAHVWSFTTTDIFAMLNKISSNVKISTICSANRYILGKAIINYTSQLPQ